MDKVIIAMLALLAVLCLISATTLAISTERRGDDMWYLQPEEADEDFDPNRPGLIVLTSLITSFILYGYLIPISLYVSLEIVKVLQVRITTRVTVWGVEKRRKEEGKGERRGLYTDHSG